MYKRILCCVLSLLMLISLMPLSAFAEGEITDPPIDAASDIPALSADEDNSGGGDSSGAQEAPPEEDTPPEEDPLPEEDAPSVEDPLPEENSPPEEDFPPGDDSPSEEDFPKVDSLPDDETPSEDGVQPEADTPPEDNAQPEEPDDNTPADESAGSLPEEDSVDPEDGEGEIEEPVEDVPAEPSEELLYLQELIASLPTADEIANMDEDALSELSELIGRILDLYDALSEEEQALVDLSALEALYEAMDAQTLETDPLKFTVTYDPTTLQCGTPVKFTLHASGGFGPYKYSVGSIMVRTKNGTYFELDRTRKSYTDKTDLTTYTFEHTFKASGTYYFDAALMDMGGGPPYPNPNFRVEFTINDPDHPSIDQMIEKLYQECMAAYPNGTDYDKALFYHDWLIKNAEYDNDLDYAGPGGVLCRGIGTCQSYHDALELLLKRSGIASEQADGGGHAWNRVCLDGIWTLIDATWDDTNIPYLRHMYFGLTDELMQQSHTHTANPNHLCNSLEKNYMILSGQITALSDPIKVEIQSLDPGNHLIDAHTGNTVADAYYKTLCPLAAYYLTNKESTLKNAGITVSYNATDKTYSVNIPCADSKHQFETVPGTPATCTQTGLTEGKRCTICDFVGVQQETISKLPHTEVTIPATPATCTKTGLTEGKKCSVCNTVTVARQVTPTVPHNKDVTIAGTPATCTKTGLTEGKKCSVCGKVTVARQTISLRPHTPVADPAVQPNGFNPGLTEGSHCSVCGKILAAQQQYFSKTALFMPSSGLSGKEI